MTDSSGPHRYPPPMPPHYHLVEEIDGTWKSGSTERMTNSDTHTHIVSRGVRKTRYLAPAKWSETHTHEEITVEH